MTIKVKIERVEKNPLLEPRPDIKWMSKNMFNCGVVIDDDGIFKMLI